VATPSDPPLEALVVAVDPVTATAPELVEVVPQQARPRAAPVQRRPPTRKLEPGDVICGACGEGNAPTRRFCRRCGDSLADAEHVRQPWWRRLRLRRGPKVLRAGQRPGSHRKGVARGIGRKIRNTMWVAVLTFGLLAVVYPPLRTDVTERLDTVRKDVLGVVDETFEPVHPDSVTANADSPGHPPSLAFDEYKNTFWAAPWTQDQPVLTAKLDDSVDLVKVIVTSGVSGDFTAYDRPSIVNLAYSNEKSDTIVLQDSPKPQTFTLSEGQGAGTVRIEVLQVHDTAGATEVAITEVEFFALG
jgi:hypothetical protein